MGERSCPRSWTSGCRCDECHGRLLDQARTRRAIAAVRRGRPPETRVSARPARLKLERLRARGLSLRVIAEMTGCSLGALQHLARGDRRRVSIVTVQRLASVDLRATRCPPTSRRTSRGQAR